MGRIQTGVDKLVALVKEEQRVSVDDAGKKLGVSKLIIQEWADFLQDEGLIEIKYSLSKTYLVDRKLSKTETAAKERQFEAQRETFVTKVDQSIGTLEQEGLGFEKFRKEFAGLKSELSASLAVVQREIGKLTQYQQEKRAVVKTVHSERARLTREESAAAKAITREYRKYHDLLHTISAQERSLAAHKAQAHEIIVGQHAASIKIATYEKLLKTLRSSARKTSSATSEDTKTLRALETNARALRLELVNIERTRLRPLVALREKHQLKLKELERTILAKAANDKRNAKKPNGSALLARKKLQEFFSRRKSVEHLLEAIEHDKRALLMDLDDLEKRAEAYRISKNAAKMDDLRKRLKSLEGGKEKLHTHITAFLKTLRTK